MAFSIYKWRNHYDSPVSGTNARRGDKLSRRRALRNASKRIADTALNDVHNMAAMVVFDTAFITRLGGRWTFE